MLASCGKMSTFAFELWAIKRNVSLFFCKVILSAFSAPNKACHLFIFIYYHTAYIGNNVICMNVFSIKKEARHTINVTCRAAGPDFFLNGTFCQRSQS